ncbi:MAG: hypothetical protein IKQ97_02425 [Eubacterium sp.]|nr:hypothetical protein [Eubacterium sp.]
MIALRIENTKEFLKLLLETEEFDSFLVGKCEVTTFVTFATDGRRRLEQQDEQESGKEHSERVYWSELKSTVTLMIRSSSVPGTLELDFFRYMNRDMGSIRISFEEGAFTLTTGYMQKEFSLDKRASEDWDDECMHYLMGNGIAVTVL